MNSRTKITSFHHSKSKEEQTASLGHGHVLAWKCNQFVDCVREIYGDIGDDHNILDDSQFTQASTYRQKRFLFCACRQIHM